MQPNTKIFRHKYLSIVLQEQIPLKALIILMFYRNFCYFAPDLVVIWNEADHELAHGYCNCTQNLHHKTRVSYYTLVLKKMITWKAYNGSDWKSFTDAKNNQKWIEGNNRHFHHIWTCFCANPHLYKWNRVYLDFYTNPCGRLWFEKLLTNGESFPTALSPAIWVETLRDGENNTQIDVLISK